MDVSDVREAVDDASDNLDWAASAATYDELVDEILGAKLTMYGLDRKLSWLEEEVELMQAEASAALQSCNG
ncbi:MAG: hypothetical protein ACT4OM_09680 [Actinomycetota bacterium]